MSKYFENMNVNVNMESEFYGDFRDWFIIDKNKIEVHKTKILFFINDEFIFKDMMPINTKIIEYKISANIKQHIVIRNIKIYIPEMGINRKSLLRNNVIVYNGDTINIEGNLKFQHE